MPTVRLSYFSNQLIFERITFQDNRCDTVAFTIIVDVIVFRVRVYRFILSGLIFQKLVEIAK